MTDPMLLVSLLALLGGAVMGLLGWRAVAAERRRARARVATLRAAAFTADDDRDFDHSGMAQKVDTYLPPPVEAEEPAAPARIPAVPDRDSAERAAWPAAAAPDMFGTTAAESGSSGAFAILVLVGLVLVAGLGFLLARGAPDGASAAAARTGEESVPLELVSLAHERTDDRWTIRGLVHNPVDSSPMRGVHVSVLLFDKAGTLIGSGRAPLGFARLGPDDEAPFEVSLEAPATLARYRVSFRTGDGSLIRHVDRRPSRKS